MMKAVTHKTIIVHTGTCKVKLMSTTDWEICRKIKTDQEGFQMIYVSGSPTGPAVYTERHRRPIILCHHHTTSSVCFESATPHLTCRVFGIGSEWRTGAAARLCYQALASTVACSGAQLPQSPLTDTPGVPAQPTLGRKAYVLSVLEHQHSPRKWGGNNMLEVMEEIKADKWKQ